MSINQRIKEIRQTLELPQKKFAERIAISTGYMAEIELGNRNVTERIIRLISMEFGVDEYWLRTGERSMFNKETDTKITKVMALFKMLNPRFQDFALFHLNELVELHNSVNKPNNDV